MGGIGVAWIRDTLVCVLGFDNIWVLREQTDPFLFGACFVEQRL